MKIRMLFANLFTVLSFLLLANNVAFADLTSVKLGLNWKAEPEFAGFYTAKLNKRFEKHGLNVDIQEGGAGTPTIQMIASGAIDFGIVSGDELVIANSQKQDLVALYAGYQKAPYMIMTRASKGFKTLGDLFKSKMTLSVIKGLPFVAFLENKFGFQNVTIVPYAGGISNFLSDENFAQQGFISSEPLLAEKKGVKTKTFLIADEGFNPYVVVVATKASTLKNKPELVNNFVAAVREGWTDYLKEPKPTQQLIAKLNPTMDIPTQTEMFKIEKDLLSMPKGSKEALGSMSEMRWKTLVDQMHELKLIKEKPLVKDLFR